MHVRKVGTTVAAATALIVAGVTVPASAAPRSTRVGLSATKPSWLSHAKTLGRASSTARSDFRVYLAPRGGMTALKTRVDAVSTPGNANYHHFLSAAAYHRQYDPSAAQVAAVTAFLKANKLSIAGVGAHERYLSVSGTIAHVQSAFHTTINRYVHDGHTVQANANPLTVPASLSGAVLTVSGIDTTPDVAKPQTATPAPPPAAFVNAHPCSTYFGQLSAKYEADYKTKLPKFQGKTLPYVVCGYTGVQFRSAYEGQTDLDGTGKTVAIIDAFASPTIAADANEYATLHRDGSYAKGQFTQRTVSSYTHATDKVCAGAGGWYGEETLDVEAVHAMAPGANIRYYAGKSCEDQDLDDALARVINENKADLITNSYGDGSEQVSTSSIVAAEALFLQAALQGQSVMFSSGDFGDDLAESGFREPSYEASDPYVTAVGATATDIDGNGTLAAETSWGTDNYALSSDAKSWTPLGFQSGSTGGYSTLFNRPSYQDGVVPADSLPGRAVPDVAMDGDTQTGILIGLTELYPDGTKHYGEYRVGGTSVSSPLFAGMTALAVQRSGRLGFLNPAIYGQASAGTFTDVSPQTAAKMGPGVVRVNYVNGVDTTKGVSYFARTFGTDSSLTVTKGWDDSTGIGSPNAKWLTAFPAA